MANKDYKVTITLTMEIGARTEEMAKERGDDLAEAACKGIYDSPYRWKPDTIEAPEVVLRELSQ